MIRSETEYKEAVRRLKEQDELLSQQKQKLEVVLVQFRLSDRVEPGERIRAKVYLRYRHIGGKKRIQVKKTVALRVVDECNGSITDAEVQKNYTIARLAHSIKSMAVCYQDKKFSAARKTLHKALGQVDRLHAKRTDKDLLRVRAIAENYYQQLRPKSIIQETSDAALN